MQEGKLARDWLIVVCARRGRAVARERATVLDTKASISAHVIELCAFSLKRAILGALGAVLPPTRGKLHGAGYKLAILHYCGPGNNSCGPISPAHCPCGERIQLLGRLCLAKVLGE